MRVQHLEEKMTGNEEIILKLTYTDSFIGEKEEFTEAYVYPYDYERVIIDSVFDVIREYGRPSKEVIDTYNVNIKSGVFHYEQSEGDASIKIDIFRGDGKKIEFADYEVTYFSI